jgi:hypothetical protein
MHRRPTLVALSVFAASAIASCRSTEPSDGLHPLSGTWQVTTSLDSFSYETPAPSPPDCPSFTMYCTHSHADTLGRLAIIMTVGISVAPGTQNSIYPLYLTEAEAATIYPVAFGTVTGRFCKVTPEQGCTSTTEVGPTPYPSGGAVGPLTLTDPSNSVKIVLRLGGADRPLVILRGRLAGDSITGNVWWAAGVTRSPPAHWGTFVARRR